MPKARGCEGRRQLVIGIHTAFPDICYTIQDLIAEGDKIVAHWSATGTQKGERLGTKPAERPLSTSGISIFRNSEGKIAEELVQFDALVQVQQLSPPP
jgi:predicted ester cyclase